MSALCEPRFELYQVVFGSIYVRTLLGQGEELLSAEMNRVPGSQSTESVKRLPANTERGLTTVWPPQGEIDKFQQNAL